MRPSITSDFLSSTEVARAPYQTNDIFLINKAHGAESLRTRRFITVFTRARSISVSWDTSVQSTMPHSISYTFILILSSHLCLGLSTGLFLSGFPYQNSVCMPLIFMTFFFIFLRTSTSVFSVVENPIFHSQRREMKALFATGLLWCSFMSFTFTWLSFKQILFTDFTTHPQFSDWPIFRGMRFVLNEGNNLSSQIRVVLCGQTGRWTCSK
jgi:hypothetical protein